MQQAPASVLGALEEALDTFSAQERSYICWRICDTGTPSVADAGRDIFRQSVCPRSPMLTDAEFTDACAPDGQMPSFQQVARLTRIQLVLLLQARAHRGYLKFTKLGGIAKTLAKQWSKMELVRAWLGDFEHRAYGGVIFVKTFTGEVAEIAGSRYDLLSDILRTACAILRKSAADSKLYIAGQETPLPGTLPLGGEGLEPGATLFLLSDNEAHLDSNKAKGEGQGGELSLAQQAKFSKQAAVLRRNQKKHELEEKKRKKQHAAERGEGAPPYERTHARARIHTHIHTHTHPSPRPPSAQPYPSAGGRARARMAEHLEGEDFRKVRFSRSLLTPFIPMTDGRDTSCSPAILCRRCLAFRRSTSLGWGSRLRTRPSITAGTTQHSVTAIPGTCRTGGFMGVSDSLEAR